MSETRTVLVPIADGIEEIEAVTIIDVLRRAGAEVTVASVGALQIIASRGVKITADALIGDCLDRHWDLVVLPGGMPGAENLRRSVDLALILVNQHSRGALYGAICASPAVVLESLGLLAGRRATCHPNFVQRLANVSSVSSPVVEDGPVITSRGPGTAILFSLKLVDRLFGPQRVREVTEPMVLN